MNKLNFLNETTYDFLWEKEVREVLAAAKEIFNSEYFLSVDLNIVDNEFIKKISNDHCNKNSATDVLSFPLNDSTINNLMKKNVLGEIYISYEKIQSQAMEFGHSEKREFLYLFSHGVVHLFGFDHIVFEEKKVLDELVDKIMEQIKVFR